MTQWKLSCEFRADIPLPPAYTFPKAFNYLNSEKNSFYILEHKNGNYIQCGGDKNACTVEIRIYESDGSYKHYTVGRTSDSTAPATVQMSNGAVCVDECEVLNHWEATVVVIQEVKILPRVEVSHQPGSGTRGPEETKV